MNNLVNSVFLTQGVLSKYSNTRQRCSFYTFGYVFWKEGAWSSIICLFILVNFSSIELPLESPAHQLGISQFEGPKWQNILSFSDSFTSGVFSVLVESLTSPQLMDVNNQICYLHVIQVTEVTELSFFISTSVFSSFKRKILKIWRNQQQRILKCSGTVTDSAVHFRCFNFKSNIFWIADRFIFILSGSTHYSRKTCCQCKHHLLA